MYYCRKCHTFWSPVMVTGKKCMRCGVILTTKERSDYYEKAKERYKDRAAVPRSACESVIA